MWISKAVWQEVFSGFQEERAKRSFAEGVVSRLKSENERLRADLDWFKLRLNQTERERAMLMQDRIGVKIDVPQFVPAMDDPQTALNQLPDMSTVGGDARPEPEPEADAGEGVDYSQMPGYQRRR